MNKSEIAKRIEAVTGTSFPNANQLATKFFKKDRDNVVKMLGDLRTFKDGRQDKYFSMDVAEFIMKNVD